MRTVDTEAVMMGLNDWLEENEGSEFWERFVQLGKSTRIKPMTLCRILSGKYIPGIRTQSALILAKIQYQPEKRRTLFGG
jgi:hypothetical protein